MLIPSEDSIKLEALQFVVSNLGYLTHTYGGESGKKIKDESHSDSDATSSSGSHKGHDLREEPSVLYNVLTDVLQDGRIRQLVHVYEILSGITSGAVTPVDNLIQGKTYLHETIEALEPFEMSVPEVQDLVSILASPNVQSLFSAFDDICHHRYEPSVSGDSLQSSSQTATTLSSSASRTSSYESNSSAGSEIHEKNQSIEPVPSATQGSSKLHQQRLIVEARTEVRVRSQMHSADMVQNDDGANRMSQAMATPKLSQRDTFPRESNLGSRTPTSISRSLQSVVQRDRTPKTIQIERNPSEPLGITVTRQDSFINGQMQSEIVVERIIADSSVDKQGLLHVGDTILTINDMPVETTEGLQRILRQLTFPSFSMKIIPGPYAYLNTSFGKDPFKTYVRTFFFYNPKTDSLLPTGNVGVKFDAGEILEVLNKSDPHYWQARRLDNTRVGLIPSITLEERRKAYNSSDHDRVQGEAFPCRKLSGIKRSKKSKKLFSVIDAPIFSEVTDIWSYEEVVQVPPIRQRCLALIGPTGVGKRSLKHMLCQTEPRRFGFPIPDSSQMSALSSGSGCRYSARGQMEDNIKKGLYLEWAEVGDQLIGIPIQALRDVIAQGKTVVFDCQPTSVRIIRQAEFNPHVVFIASPSVDVLRAMQNNGLAKGIQVTRRTDEDFRLLVEQSAQYERLYRHLYQTIIVNDNMISTVNRLIGLIRHLERHPQWIPVVWEEELAPSHRLSMACGESDGIIDDNVSIFSGSQPPPSYTSETTHRSYVSSNHSEASTSQLRSRQPVLPLDGIPKRRVDTDETSSIASTQSDATFIKHSDTPPTLPQQKYPSVPVPQPRRTSQGSTSIASTVSYQQRLTSSKPTRVLSPRVATEPTQYSAPPPLPTVRPPPLPEHVSRGNHPNANTSNHVPQSRSVVSYTSSEDSSSDSESSSSATANVQQAGHHR